jgi:hypothetical protein
MSGDAEITILDGGGNVVVPGATVQLVIGCADDGPVAAVMATRNPNTLVDVFKRGPLVEAAALSCLKGGTVLAMRAASVTPGENTAVQFTGTGDSVITVTGEPVDDYNVQLRVIKGGTVGTIGITFRLSLDGGRNEGPVIALGQASTFPISNTGLTLHFAAGALVAGDKAKFSSTAPAWDIGAVEACVAAVEASQYGVVGWGSAHLVGTIDGAGAQTLGDDLDDNARTQFSFTRFLMSARDAATPEDWGGAGESETDWVNALALDFSEVSAKRVLVTGGHYNMPSAFPNAHAGSPRFRRPLSWAMAARRVTIPPQRHDGRVRDNALSNITIDPSKDPLDGFVYHDEFQNPGLDEARLATARSRKKKPGFFVVQPNLMSPPGSVFSILPLGNVMDVACGIVHDVGEDEINEDIGLNPNGTIVDAEARAIEATMYGQIKVQMIDTKEISSATVVVTRDNNIAVEKKVKITVTIVARGYVLTEEVTIGFANTLAAGG